MGRDHAAPLAKGTPMKTSALAAGSTAAGFVVDRIQQIPELRCTALQLTHVKTGARLLHLHNEDPNNLFCCAFRTPVFDSTGVPHILEHSVLGGSRKFPVKDPFQQVLKCSLQTFLNALTYPDKTLYPVASQVDKDYYNLVDIYCDAVFHPLLTRNTFYQEGWHFDVEDTAKPVSIKGIVYNEMKGVFSEFTNHVARRTLSALYPDTTYFHESGGDPEHIPALTYESFKSFHERFYHPSNSFIFVYGAQDTVRTCEFLDRHYLSAFDRITVDSAVVAQKPWDSPREVTIDAPAPAEDAGTATVNVCWLAGAASDPVRTFAFNVLARYLLDGESSPLRRALIDSGLGEDLDAIAGFEADLVQSMFAAGLRKTKAEHAPAIRKIIFDTLRAQTGTAMDEQLLEGCLRQAEFSLREVADSGRWPYGLKLAERVYRSWIYGRRPPRPPPVRTTLAAIRADGAATFFRNLIRTALLENPHHVVCTVKASPEMADQLQKQTEAQAQELSRNFAPADIQKYHRITTDLLAEQKRQPTATELASLPRIGRSDLPARGIDTPVQESSHAGVRILAHPIFCGGIVYCDLGFDCAGIPASLQPFIPIYTELLARCGAGSFTAEQMATRVSLATGGIASSHMLEPGAGLSAAMEQRLWIHAKCLPERFDDMTAILRDMLFAPRLNDPKLIADILLEMRNGMHSSIIGSGHQYAATHAAAQLDAIRARSETIDGIAQLRLLDQLARDKDPDALVERVRELHALVASRTGAIVSVTADTPDRWGTAMASLASGLAANAPASHERPQDPSANPCNTGIEIGASVNFVAKAWRLPLLDPHTVGQLGVLSANLSRGFLWDRVRVEGGAYGSFASMGSHYPVFVCSSYRDPNLERTLQAFDDAVAFGTTRISDSEVDESVVSTIGQLDKPHTPHARGYSETLALMTGRTREYRQQVRDAILGATAQKVRTAAEMISGAKQCAVTVLGGAQALGSTSAGLALERQALLAGAPGSSS